MSRILVTGARGQLGSDLVVALRQCYGASQVIESGRSQSVLQRSVFPGELPLLSQQNLPYELMDVRDSQRLHDLVEQYQIDTLYHLASLLSATGEQDPDSCWDINVNGLKNVLEVARLHNLKVFWPSSIAVFGAHTPKLDTPQITIADPSTMYGITKATGELLCHYYAQRFGIDVRSVRLPGLISSTAPPGGGTTDFAVEMFEAALQSSTYTCFVRSETRLPMMYMPDAVRAILTLMQANAATIAIRSSYNIAAVSFSAADLAAEIQTHLPDFTCRYAPDFRQDIADSWPSSIDDSQARLDWGWQPAYDLPAIVDDMLAKLSAKQTEQSQPQLA